MRKSYRDGMMVVQQIPHLPECARAQKDDAPCDCGSVGAREAKAHAEEARDDARKG